jgi:plasmid stabilization system protein ParE
MAEEKSPLAVIRSPAAIDDLDEIWRWNAERYGVPHADNYLRYLKAAIDGLASSYAKGNAVGVRPDLRYILIRRRAKGHGHVVVYQVDREAVHVLHIFHTAQDWKTTLGSGSG